MMQFSQSNLDKFFEKLIAHYQSIEIEYEAQGQLERSLTRNHVGPALQKFVNSLIMPQLIVRYDGHKSVRPLLRHGMTFLPDAQVTLGNQKIVAIEVKILRDGDPSGSLSKAIGQTYLYRALGFEMSMGIIVDARSRKHSGLEVPLELIDNLENRVKFILFNSI
jgi:hypothetical protein